MVFDSGVVEVTMSGGWAAQQSINEIGQVLGTSHAPFPETTVLRHELDAYPSRPSNVGFAASTGAANAWQWIDNVVVVEAPAQSSRNIFDVDGDGLTGGQPGWVVTYIPDSEGLVRNSALDALLISEIDSIDSQADIDALLSVDLNEPISLETLFAEVEGLQMSALVEGGIVVGNHYQQYSINDGREATPEQLGENHAGYDSLLRLAQPIFFPGAPDLAPGSESLLDQSRLDYFPDLLDVSYRPPDPDNSVRVYPGKPPEWALGAIDGTDRGLVDWGGNVSGFREQFNLGVDPEGRLVYAQYHPGADTGEIQEEVNGTYLTAQA